ncbi:MAG: hypothetical protein FJZ01_12360 [Candidatus Sericytochromatia bacterium]|nr:hypothetical protein [Candidatus Tanganyikabacteria bacterium]
MRTMRAVGGFLAVALLAGCGAGSVATPTKATAASNGAAATAGSQSATVARDVRTKYAWVRLRQQSYFVHPGDRVRMLLDIISSDKPVDRAEARWRSWDGRFDRWITRTPWLDNDWTAPSRAGGYRLDVDLEITYTDGTWEDTRLNEIVWVR